MVHVIGPLIVMLTLVLADTSQPAGVDPFTHFVALSVARLTRFHFLFIKSVPFTYKRRKSCNFAGVLNAGTVFIVFFVGFGLSSRIVGDDLDIGMDIVVGSQFNLFVILAFVHTISSTLTHRLTVIKKKIVNLNTVYAYSICQ